MIVSGGGVPEQQLAAIGASRTFDAADPAFAEWARRGLAMDVEGDDEGGPLLGVLDMLGHEPAIDTMGRARYLSLAPPRLVTLEQVPIFTRASPWRTHPPPAVLVTAISARCQDGAVGALRAWCRRLDAFRPHHAAQWFETGVLKGHVPGLGRQGVARCRAGAVHTEAGARIAGDAECNAKRWR